MIVEIEEVLNAMVFVYLMPTNTSQTKGIFENNKFHSLVKGGKFVAPSDWKIWIVYNPMNKFGHIKIKSWVE
jgi:hypothetical protein